MLSAKEPSQLTQTASGAHTIGSAGSGVPARSRRTFDSAGEGHSASAVAYSLNAVQVPFSRAIRAKASSAAITALGLASA